MNGAVPGLRGAMPDARSNTGLAPQGARQQLWHSLLQEMVVAAATVEVDAYVFDALMPDLVGHDRAPAALVVFLALWRQTRGTGVASVQISLSDLSIATGLSKRAVQDAIGRLRRRRLIAVERESLTAVPVYAVRRPWVRG